MIDVTVDLETRSLSPTAAVMSIGAVAWKRYGKESPFFDEGDGVLRNSTFSAHVDLRSMFLNGFTFDQSTADWWAKQSDEAKAALLDSDSDESPCQPIDVVVNDLFGWIEYIKKKLGDEDLCLWAQGTDFDPAILRYISVTSWASSSRLSIPDDSRKFKIERARIIWDAAEPNEERFDLDKAYALTTDYKDIADEGAAHDPIFDCKRSIYSTWQMMKKIREGYAKAI